MVNRHLNRYRKSRVSSHSASVLVLVLVHFSRSLSSWKEGCRGWWVGWVVGLVGGGWWVVGVYVSKPRDRFEKFYGIDWHR